MGRVNTLPAVGGVREHGHMDVTDWLLDSDPSIRWQVMADLLDRPGEAVAAERARVAAEGWGARLLALQAHDGYWGGDEYGEQGARTSVTWTLHLLRRFGIDPDAPQARSAVARVRDGVTWRHWNDLPYFHGEVEPCINGGVLALGAYFGVLGAGSDRIVERLLAEQLDDGGWNCGVRGGCWGPPAREGWRGAGGCRAPTAAGTAMRPSRRAPPSTPPCACSRGCSSTSARSATPGPAPP